MTLTKGHARNAAVAPLDVRLQDMAQIVCNADGSPRTGVFGNAGTSIVTTTGTMNVAVAAAEFVTSKGKSDGVMIFTNDGTVNVLIGAAPGSNSRIDVIWVKQEDNTTGDAASLPIFGVTAGAAAASPVKSAIPTGALELATLRIYSGTVATNGGANVLTNTYQMTASRGGIVPFRTKAELDLWTNPTPFQRAITVDTGDEYIRSGTVWIAAAGRLSHVEYQFNRAGIGDGSVTLFNTAVDATRTNDTAFTSIPGATGNTVTLALAGNYAISFHGSLSIAGSGRNFVSISTAADGVIVRGFFGSPEDTATASQPAFVALTAGVVLSFTFFKTTGGNADITGKVRITRLGGF